MNAPKTKAMATLFCAMVAARKGHNSMRDMLRILPISPEIKAMALRSWTVELAR